MLSIPVHCNQNPVHYGLIQGSYRVKKQHLLLSKSRTTTFHAQAQSSPIFLWNRNSQWLFNIWQKPFNLQRLSSSDCSDSARIPTSSDGNLSQQGRQLRTQTAKTPRVVFPSRMHVKSAWRLVFPLGDCVLKCFSTCQQNVFHQR